MCLNNRVVGPVPSFIVKVNANVRASVVYHHQLLRQQDVVRPAMNQKMDGTMHLSMLFVVLVHNPTYVELNQTSVDVRHLQKLYNAKKRKIKRTK